MARIGRRVREGRPRGPTPSSTAATTTGSAAAQSGSEAANDLEPFRDSLRSWTEAAVRRMAESAIVSRDRIDALATACRGMIVISTLDFLYRDRAREETWRGSRSPIYCVASGDRIGAAGGDENPAG